MLKTQDLNGCIGTANMLKHKDDHNEDDLDDFYDLIYAAIHLKLSAKEILHTILEMQNY